MGIMLGNLTVAEIEKRIGVDFSQDVRDFMDAARQAKAGPVAPGAWHCFDLPFCIVCGDVRTATRIYNSVKGRAHEVKENLEFAVQGAI